MIIQSEYNVTSSKLFSSTNTFHPEGLFSEVIFGNKKPFTCKCGKTTGVKNFGKRCPECNVLVGPTSLRRYVVSAIEFPFPIIHPLLALYKLPYALLNRIRYEQILTSTAYDEAEEYLTTKYEHNNKVNIPLYTDRLIVLPPAVRAINILDKTNMNLDKINSIYLNILTLLEKLDIQVDKPDQLIKQVKQILLNLSIQAYDYIIQHLTKKEGVLRKYVLGKKNDFTGRTVITVDPRLKIDEVRVPYVMFCAGYFPQVLYELSKSYNGIVAYDLLTKYMNMEEAVPLNIQLEIEDTINRVANDKIVLLNRQPTLHRSSIQAFKPILSKQKTLSIPMQICNPFNADFDGDTMAIYFPQTDSAIKEAKEKMMSSKNLLLPGSLQYGAFTQDLVLGLWFVTSEEGDKSQILEITNVKQVFDLKLGTWIKYNNEINTAGRFLVSQILGIPITTALTKKQIYNILTTLIQTDDPNIVDKLHNLQQLTLKYTLVSISINDFVEEGEWAHNYDNVNWNQLTIRKLAEETAASKKQLTLTQNISAMITSGARGSLDQWSQCTLLRGFVRNANGKLMLPPVLSSLIEGYSPTEVVLSSVGNRKGIIDKALSTANSGYLTRKLVYSTQHILLTDEEDCGTTEGITVTLTKQNIDKYLFRYTTDDQYIDQSNYKDFIDKTVTLRSPLHCHSKTGICKKCFSIHKFYNSRNIGFIVAQALGEPGTQLVLRSFHTGGSAELKLLDLPNVFTITNDDMYICEQDVELQSENLVVDIDNRLVNDADVIVSWDDNQEIIMLPKNTRILTDADQFLGVHKAKTKLFTIELGTIDLATDLTFVSSMLGKKYTLSYSEALNHLTQLENLYWGYQNIHSLHFELLHSERLRTLDGDYLRYIDNVSLSDTVVLQSISNIAHSRLLLSLCFENFRKFFNTYLASTQVELSPLEKLIDNLNSLQ